MVAQQQWQVPIHSWEHVSVPDGVPQFVTTPGGGYFSVPSRSSVRNFAALILSRPYRRHQSSSCESAT